MDSPLPVYSVRDWAKLYETAETRKLVRLTWVPVPNKHDGRGLRRLLRMENGMGIFAAWMLILQVASKMPQRGILRDQDGPLESQDIGDKTGGDVPMIKAALAILSSKEIGWLLCESPGIPGESPGTSGAKGLEGNGLETTGRESNGTEGKEPPPSAAPVLHFPKTSISAWPLVSQQIRMLYPSTDDEMVMKIVNCALEAHPSVSDPVLHIGIKETYQGQRGQRSAALWLKTIPTWVNNFARRSA